MSLAIVLTIKCDSCGTELQFKPETRSTEARWYVRHGKAEAEKDGWVSLSRGYKPEGHYCPKCADSPLKKE